MSKELKDLINKSQEVIELKSKPLSQEEIDKILRKINETPCTITAPALPQGWQCPKCGAVMSPWQSSCINCNGYSQWTITWDSTPCNPFWDWTKVTCNDTTTVTTNI